MKVVGLGEHFATPELIDAWQALEPQWRDVGIPGSVDDELGRRLVDLDVDRIAAMDATGLDVSVVSMTTPGLQNLDRHPDRLQGFATLPRHGRMQRRPNSTGR